MFSQADLRRGEIADTNDLADRLSHKLSPAVVTVKTSIQSKMVAVVVVVVG